MMIRYNVLRTGPERVVTQVNHPQSSNYEASATVVPIPGGFEFRPVDEPPDDKNIARFMIVDDSTMTLVLAQGEAQTDIVRVRCAPAPPN
jgi:hypothetical protein